MKKKLLTSILSLAFCLTVFGTQANAATGSESTANKDGKPGNTQSWVELVPGISTPAGTAEVVKGKDTDVTLTNGINVVFPAGSLPENIKSIVLKADGISDMPAGFADALSKIPTMSSATLYDLKVTGKDDKDADVNITKFTKDVTVTLPAQKGQNDAIYFDGNNTVEDLDATLTKDDTITFPTSHFSIYGTVKNTAAPTNPETGDSSSIAIVSIVALVAAAGLFASKKLAINK